jgi:hypothetical protein
MTKRIYLQDRAGQIHVWDNNVNSTWQRAVCSDPGDFNELRRHDCEITCPRCRKALGMPTQQLLFE